MIFAAAGERSQYILNWMSFSCSRRAVTVCRVASEQAAHTVRALRARLRLDHWSRISDWFADSLSATCWLFCNSNACINHVKSWKYYLPAVILLCSHQICLKMLVICLFCLGSGSINACEKTSFVFLRQELPVRLSNIMKEINLLPDKLLTTPSVRMVQSW